MGAMASFLEHLGRSALRLRGYSSRQVATPVGKVHVLDRSGQGRLPHTVLIHGFSAAGVHYLPMLRRLEPHVRRLIVPDMPAHGFSAPPIGDASVDHMRDGLFTALDDRLNEPAVVFGNSLGGFAAIHYALERPEKVRALVLCSPAGAAMTDGEFDALIAVFKMKSHGEALAFVDRLYARRQRLRHLFAWLVRRNLSRGDIQAVLSTMAASRERLLTPEQLGSLRMPILLLWGKDERILSVEQREFFRAHLPSHAHIVEPEGCGHSPFLERPGMITRAVLDFMKQLDRGAPARQLAFASRA